MKAMIEDLLRTYVNQLKKTYGAKLDRVILFGSYARGDSHENSDVDIMVLLNVPQDAISVWKRAVNRDTYEFNMEHAMDIEPVVISREHFQRWIVSPFYHTVLSEGVLLYDAAA